MASFKDQEILDALLASASGKGKTAALKLWECEVINSLGWRESTWVRLPIEERYRKLVAFKLSGWLGMLEQEEEIKRLKIRGTT